MNEDFISNFQLIGNSVKSVKIRNDFVAIDSNQNYKRKIDISHEVKSANFSEEDQEFIGILLLNIKVNISQGKQKYSIDLSIEGCFGSSSKMKQSEFEEMLQLNGITSLYSIARGFVQSVSAQTLVDGNVLLPMFNVIAYLESLKKDE